MMTIGLILALALGAAGEQTGAIKLPHIAAGWVLARGPETFDNRTIFDYMDGAAEVYMNYAFRAMHLGEYAKGDKRLAVEVYDMSEAPEAFGIFSNSPAGEKLKLGQDARYNWGILSFWQGRYFVRAFERAGDQGLRADMTGIAKEVARVLGGRGALPDMLEYLPVDKHRPAQVHYFHKDYNLNSLYYVSTENVLALSTETDCALGDCAPQEAVEGASGPPRGIKMLVIRYKTAADRDRGWAGFCEKVLAVSPSTGGDTPVAEVEKGLFAGIKKASDRSRKPMLAICFEAQSADECRAVLAALPKMP